MVLFFPVDKMFTNQMMYRIINSISIHLSKIHPGCESVVFLPHRRVCIAIVHIADVPHVPNEILGADFDPLQGECDPFPNISSNSILLREAASRKLEQYFSSPENKQLERLTAPQCSC